METLNLDHATDHAIEPSVTATMQATFAMLVIAPWHARLLLCDEWSTVEVLDRFPVVTLVGPRRRFGRRRDHQEITRMGFNWRIYSALSATVPEGLPIVLAGEPTFVASFERHAAERGLNVVGVIDGDHSHASPTFLKSRARAVVDSQL